MEDLYWPRQALLFAIKDAEQAKFYKISLAKEFFLKRIKWRHLLFMMFKDHCHLKLTGKYMY